jgi:hypothetical protein
MSCDAFEKMQLRSTNAAQCRCVARTSQLAPGQQRCSAHLGHLGHCHVSKPPAPPPRAMAAAGGSALVAAPVRVVL